MDQELPFHVSTKVWLVAEAEKPTATQLVELVHHTPRSSLSSSVVPSLGLVMMDQKVPFQVSTRVWFTLIAGESGLTTTTSV